MIFIIDKYFDKQDNINFLGSALKLNYNVIIYFQPILNVCFLV